VLLYQSTEHSDIVFKILFLKIFAMMLKRIVPRVLVSGHRTAFFLSGTGKVEKVPDHERYITRVGISHF
jgi:hypothetical protein